MGQRHIRSRQNRINIILVIISLIVFFTLMSSTPANAEEKNGMEFSSDEIISSGYGEARVHLENDFSFIKAESDEINWNLALQTLLISNQIYGDDKVEKLLYNLGYDYARVSSNRSNLWHPVSCLAYKHISNSRDDKNIFVVAVRGTENITDLVSDITDGSGLSSNSLTQWDISRDRVKSDCLKLMMEATGESFEQLKKEDNYIVLTGHSWGGAVANLLSVDEDILALVGNDKNRIYAYTYESPHTCNNYWWWPVGNMSNAFNFKDCDDFVANIPPWIGATTYGKDKSFSVNDLDNSIFAELFPNAKGKSVTEAPKNENYSDSPWGHHDIGLDLVYILQNGGKYGWWHASENDSNPTIDEGEYMKRFLKAYKAGDESEALEWSEKMSEYASEECVNSMPGDMKAAYLNKINEFTDNVTFNSYGSPEGNYVVGYYLTDLENDGKCNLIIKYGSCEADFKYYFYRYKGGRAMEIGSIAGGHSSLNAYQNNNGIVLFYAHMGEEAISHIKYLNGEFVEERIGGIITESEYTGLRNKLYSHALENSYKTQEFDCEDLL